MLNLVQGFPTTDVISLVCCDTNLDQIHRTESGCRLMLTRGPLGVFLGGGGLRLASVTALGLKSVGP